MNHFLKSKRGTRWINIDIIIASLSFLFAYSLSPYQTIANIKGLEFSMALTYGICLAMTYRIIEVPRPGFDFRISRYDIFSFALIGSLVATASFSLIYSLYFFDTMGRFILLYATLISYIASSLFRVACSSTMSKRPIQIALIGSPEQNESLSQKLKDEKYWEVTHHIDLENKDELPENKLRDLRSTCDVAVVCMENLQCPQLKAKLLDLPLHGVDLLNRSAFMDKYYREINLDYIDFQWLISFPTVAAESAIFFSKRCFDFFCALLVFLITLPAWPFIMLAIFIQDWGNPFYSQVRVGHYGKEFKILKFRTMIKESEKNGAQWASQKDNRITFIGNFLRKTRLDELPQLINVFKGEMSFVGPRPERPEIEVELKEEIPLYERRHLVPPGLTGWAQINYGYGSCIEDSKRKLEYDLYYIKHISFTFDLKVLLRTIPLIMRGSR